MKIVSGYGNKEAKIAFVGEAPGREEVKRGIPFVGAAGRLLTDLMICAGISPKDIYKTNVIKVRPPNNDVRVFVDVSKKNVKKTPIYEESVSYLKEELSSLPNLNVIVAVGNVSLWALCGLREITKRRGSVYESTLIPGKKVIPIIHPASALRKYEYTHYIGFDLTRIAWEAERPGIDIPQPRLIINPSYSEAHEYLSDLYRNASIFAFDIEVFNEEVSCISFAPSSEEAISIPFTTGYRLEEEANIWDMIASLLMDKDRVKVGQNLTFDSTFLFRKYGIRVSNIRDTMVGQALVNPDFPKGLDFITSIYTRHPYYKDDIKKYSRMEVSEEAFWRYNAMDSIVCMEALPKIENDLKILGNYEIYRKTCELIEVLVYMGERGTLLDVERMRKDSREMETTIHDLQEELNRVAGRELNPNSPKQLKDYFYITKGIRPYISRSGLSKGKITVDERALRGIALKGYKEASLILQIRKLRKLKSTYLDIVVSDDNRIRASYNPVGTKQGRLASSKNIFGEGTNRQNAPPQFKRYELADPGYIIYNLDLAQAENRIVAHIAPEMSMIDAFAKGYDLHKRTASAIFGIPEEEVSDEEGSADIGGGAYSQRFWGKKANHSFNYGLGSNQFAYLFEISRAEAKRIRTAFLERYPGIENYWRWIQTTLRNNGGRLTNLFGRTYKFSSRWGEEMFKQAYSFIPQSTVADIVNQWGLLYIWNEPSLEKVEILNQVHDSIVFQIPINVGLEYHAMALRKIASSLSSTLNWKGMEFNIPVDCKAGLNLGDVEEIDLDGDIESQLTQIIKRKE